MIVFDPPTREKIQKITKNDEMTAALEDLFVQSGKALPEEIEALKADIEFIKAHLGI